ncbi:MAG: hypothetical protein QOI74_1409 [Micromonosporaceae bacterium]|nr:hypothetical protein [Micromonosporaceae bacterium]
MLASKYAVVTHDIRSRAVKGNHVAATSAVLGHQRPHRVS